MKQTVTVRVPATSANLGPGFDSLGMALDIWNSIDVRVGKFGVEIIGEGHDTLPFSSDNMVASCFRIPFEESGEDVPIANIVCRNNVPLDRGLGSSSAAIVGGLLAGNELCDNPLSNERLLALAASLEGHPDNVAPALFGGCRIVAKDGNQFVNVGVPVPAQLKAVLFIPDVSMCTGNARDILKPTVRREDAVFNIARTALFVRALMTNDMSYMKIATEDRLHQSERQIIFPAMKNIIRGAINAGALGAFLSGSGSSVLALALDREFTIGYEMADAAAKSGISGSIKVTSPTDRGAHVVSSE